MVKFGEYVLVGDLNAEGKEYQSSILFEVEKVVVGDFCFNIDSWLVTVTKTGYVMARTTKLLRDKKLFEKGYEVCGKALDLLLVMGKKSTGIKKNKTRYICVQRTGKNGKYKVTIRELDYMETSSHVTVSVMDKDGNFKEEKTILKKDWNSAYRYYRLAENSTNAYDAYHWMYLTLERVLNDRVPKEFGEEEGKWLKKALETVAQECDWYKDLYEERNYLDCFFKEQYTDVRCKLFHAKENVCLPNEWPTQYLVYQALNKLEKVCQRLMKYYYKCRIESGGLTEAGFYFCGCRPIEKSTGFLSMEKVSVDAEKLGDAIYLEQDDEKTKLEDGVFTVAYEGMLEADKTVCVKDFGICVGNTPLVVGNFKGFELLLENVGRVEYVYRLVSKSGNRPTVRYLMV